MPGRLLLSPVPESAGKLRRPPPGRWYAEPDFLNQFSTDILVEGTVGPRQIVRGVPSVFAQPIYFAHALGDRKHPAHAAAVGQWRGLLACFALQRWLRLPLRVERFDLGGGTAPGGSADGIFRTVLAAQLPAPADDWRQWWLLRCGDALLGATSPWSLVYPPAHSEAPASVPWRRSGVLVDPIDHYDERRQRRSSRELSLLLAWVERVFAGHENRWGARGGNAWDHTLSLVTDSLAAWRRDLEPYRLAEDDGRDCATELGEVPAPYGAFLQAIDIQGVRPESLTIHDRDGREFVVLKRHGLDGHRRVHGSILVDELDLAAMPAEASAGWRTRAGREVDVPYLFVEEVLLAPKLSRIPLSASALSLDDGGFALPLRSEVFRFFGYQDLRSGRLQVGLREDGDDYLVRLTLPLSDGSELAVERRYDRKDDVVSVEPSTAPALALWPDFVVPEWRHSLALFAAPQDATVAVAPVALDGTLLDRSPGERGERDWVAWRSERPLLGFALFETGTRGESEAGLILRAEVPAPAPPDPDARWRVAVDFGTSSTQLMVATVDDPRPRPLDLQPRTVGLTRGADIFEVEAREAFFPAEGEVRSPFPTVLLKNQGWAVTPVPGAVGGELHSPRFDPKPGAALTGDIRDLKWPREGGGRGDLPIRQYLTILAQGIAAEAIAAGVAELVLHWSYPLALPPGPKAAMSNFWQTVPEAFRRVGFRVSITDESGRSESEAMSRFFASLPGALPVRSGALSIAVDVGGGSTDIGYWSQERFLDQLSFKLAGNDLLVPLALRVPRFLESLFEICLESQPTAEEVAAMRQHPEVSVNAILRSGRGSVPQAIHGRLPAGEPPWSIVRSVIYLFFAGVSFYLGLHARRLLDRVSKKELAILFGGRAAGLLPWLSNDPETLEKVLGSMLIAGLGYDDTTRQQWPVRLYGPGIRTMKSDLPPKTEVAFGLLLKPLSGEKPVTPTATVLGEEGWRLTADAPEAVHWDHEVDLATLEVVHAPDNLETGFAPYLAATLVPRHAEELSLDRANLRSLRLAVSDVENTVRTLAAKGVMQPVFASELKRLIEQYLEAAV
jgi:hypothetical protein